MGATRGRAIREGDFIFPLDRALKGNSDTVWRRWRRVTFNALSPQSAWRENNKFMVKALHGKVALMVIVWLLLYAHRHWSILGAAGHIILTPANQLMVE
jgi:hypothetical protein